MNELAVLIRDFRGSSWYELWEMVSNLSFNEKDELFGLLLTNLKYVDYEQQTRMIGIMIPRYLDTALPYINIIALSSGSELIKEHACWLLQGWADSAWIPLLSHLALNDSSPGVRRSAIVTLSFIDDERVSPILEQVKNHDKGTYDGELLSELAQKLLLAK